MQPSEHLLFGAAAFLAGVLGWVLPYRWNPLRLKRRLARHLSARANRAVPKVMGTALIVGGGALFVHALVAKFGP